MVLYACPSLELLAQHSFNRFYYTLYDAFKRREGRFDNSFTRYWGYLIQAYAEALFRGVMSAGGASATVWFASSESKYAKGQKEIPDICVAGPRATLFFEVGTSNLRAPALFQGDVEAIKRDMEKAIVKKARQLDGRICDYRAGAFALGDGACPHSRLIVPVIVTTGYRPVQPPGHRYLAEELRRRNLLVQEAVLPLQILSLNDLEYLMNLSASGSMISELLTEKALQEQHRPRKSLPHWVEAEGIKDPDPERRHPLLTAGFESFFRNMEISMFGRR